MSLVQPWLQSGVVTMFAAGAGDRGLDGQIPHRMGAGDRAVFDRGCRPCPSEGLVTACGRAFAQIDIGLFGCGRQQHDFTDRLVGSGSTQLTSLVERLLARVTVAAITYKNFCGICHLQGAWPPDRTRRECAVRQEKLLGHLAHCWPVRDPLPTVALSSGCG